METLRTFIALDLPEPVRREIIRLQQRLMQHRFGVRWVKPEGLHLTLKFLGATSAEQAAAVAAVLAAAAHGVAPFSMTISGMGAFPNSRNPKVLWLGVAVDDRLRALQARLETELEPHGFPREKRPFTPHLTLGRVREGAGRRELSACIEEHRGQPFGSGEASRLVFYRSELTPAGPVYTVLSEINLHAHNRRVTA